MSGVGNQRNAPEGDPHRRFDNDLRSVADDVRPRRANECLAARIIYYRLF